MIITFVIMMNKVRKSVKTNEYIEQKLENDNIKVFTNGKESFFKIITQRGSSKFL